MSQRNNGRRGNVCEFWARNLPEHFPKERKFSRIDEHFVRVGRFIRYDPIDPSPNFIDPPHKRPKRNREQRRKDSALAIRGHAKKRTDIQRWSARKERERVRSNRRRAQMKRRRAARCH